jgi:hypothetical protein
VIAAATFLPAVFLCLRGANPFDVNGWMGTLATYGFLTAYGMVCVAAPIRLYRERRLTVVSAAVALGALVIVGGTLWMSIDLSAPAPNNWLPFLYVGLLVAGMLVSAFRRRRT